MLMLAFRLIWKDNGGKQHCLRFVGSSLWVETFLKKKKHQKRMHWNRGLRDLCILCIGFSRKFYAKACLLFNCFLVTKRILKALFSFIPWLLNFSDLPNYGSNSRKRYILRLLLKCLVRSTLLPIDGKIPPQPCDTLFDSFRWALTHQALFLFILPSHHMNLRDQPWRPQDAYTLVQNWHLWL